jgi:hypothetical protein
MLTFSRIFFGFTQEIKRETIINVFFHRIVFLIFTWSKMQYVGNVKNTRMKRAISASSIYFIATETLYSVGN